jgi:hypothetical protein
MSECDAEVKPDENGERENLLKWLPCLTKEDLRAIAYAMLNHHPSETLTTNYATHYQLACAIEALALLKRKHVIAALSEANRSSYTRFTPFHESTYVALCKLKEDKK